MLCDASSQSDSDLLRRWSEEQSQNAFSELVRRYERLVAGAALRWAGDIELARDVSQQVFSMLSSKAHLLVGHGTIAGWLYRASSHVAAEVCRANVRRQVRQTATAERPPDPPPAEEHWPLLDEALVKLSGSDREALLLHYFQDLSYPEMAVQLGIGEAAARKRVSRGIQKLGQVLRKRGLRSPKSLLAGAVALQATYPAQTTVAAGALAGSSTTPFPLILHALMSHLSLKIAVCAATLALVPLGYQRSANATLRTNLAQRPPLPPAGASSAPQSSVDAALAEARAELARVEAKAKGAEARVAELASFKARSNEELVVSMGTVEAMAKTIAATVRQLGELRELAPKKPGDPEEREIVERREALMQKTQEGMGEFFAMLRELPRLERDPAKAARFYATLLGESAELDEAARGKLEVPLQARVAQLQESSLALPQRPTVHTEEIAEWDKRRIAAMQDIGRQLESFIPAETQNRASLFRALMIEQDAAAAGEAFDIISGRRQ